jgi:hypothetical protein
VSDDEAEDMAADIIEGEVHGIPPTAGALGELLNTILNRTRERDDEHPDVEVVIIGGPRREPELPDYKTDEEREQEERDASHSAIHTIVDVHMLSRAIGEASKDENTFAFDQANAEVHHLIGHLPLNRLRNVALIACTMIDTQALGAAVMEYCGKQLGEDDDD